MHHQDIILITSKDEYSSKPAILGGAPPSGPGTVQGWDTD